MLQVLGQLQVEWLDKLEMVEPEEGPGGVVCAPFRDGEVHGAYGDVGCHGQGAPRSREKLRARPALDVEGFTGGGVRSMHSSREGRRGDAGRQGHHERHGRFGQGRIRGKHGEAQHDSIHDLFAAHHDGLLPRAQRARARHLLQRRVRHALEHVLTLGGCGDRGIAAAVVRRGLGERSQV
jgi:hypothetical protein